MPLSCCPRNAAAAALSRNDIGLRKMVTEALLLEPAAPVAELGAGLVEAVDGELVDGDDGGDDHDEHGDDNRRVGDPGVAPQEGGERGGRCGGRRGRSRRLVGIGGGAVGRGLIGGGLSAHGRLRSVYPVDGIRRRTAWRRLGIATTARRRRRRRLLVEDASFEGHARRQHDREDDGDRPRERDDQFEDADDVITRNRRHRRRRHRN
mmetsp:Transcript_18876/g.75292  ORF Transcript_18876/g.75292 Transcript_18876/m.75292 type:complete len:207 (+) Transcript_18876:97-717(+)